MLNVKMLYNKETGKFSITPQSASRQPELSALRLVKDKHWSYIRGFIMSTNAAAWKSNIHLKNVRVAKARHVSVLICQIYSAKSLLDEVSAHSLTFLKSQFNMAFY